MTEPRRASAKEAEAVKRAIETARQEGFLGRLTLDGLLEVVSPWLELDSLRAKPTEYAEPSRHYGVAFVPARRPFFQEGKYTIVALEMPVVMIVLPAASVVAARRAAEPLRELLTIELARLEAEHRRRGLPPPPFSEGSQF